MARRRASNRRRLTNKELNTRILWGVGLTAAAGIGYGIYRMQKNNDLLKALKEREKWQIGNVNLEQVAIEIYDSFFNNDWFGATECEKCAMDALKKVPKNYIPQLAMIYAQRYDRDLYSDFREYLSVEQYNEIEYLLN